MINIAPDQQAMLAAWQQHTYAEFVLKDADAALATMTENPYVLLISSGTGGTCRAGRPPREARYCRFELPRVRLRSGRLATLAKETRPTLKRKLATLWSTDVIISRKPAFHCSLPSVVV